MSAFVAAQQWIRLAGRHEVVIPYADVLAELVDPSEVRVRRDFPQTLSLIQASAVLHQRQRDRDDQGRIVASFEDYELVHELVEESLKSATGSLTSAQRAAVEAVQTLYESGQQEWVRAAAVATALGIERCGSLWNLLRGSGSPRRRLVTRGRRRRLLDEVLELLAPAGMAEFP